MENLKQHNSLQQYSNDINDKLSALRSLLEWAVFIVLIVLAATVLFNLFYRIDRVDDVDIRDHSSVYVVVRQSTDPLEQGDTVITEAKQFASVMKINADEVLLSLDEGKSTFTVNKNDINGVAEIIVYPFECTGMDVFSVTGGKQA